MRVTVIPIVVGALGTVHKSLEKGVEELEIRGLTETIRTRVFLDRTEYSKEYHIDHPLLLM